MPFIVSCKRIWRLGLERLARDRSSSGAALVIMVIAISMASSLVLFQGMGKLLVERLEESVDVSAYFKEGVLEEEILNIRQEVLSIPEVREVTYVSKEEALKRFEESRKDDLVVIESLEAIGYNPLLASINIRAWETGQYQDISSFLESSPFASAIQAVDYQDRAPVIQRLSVLISSIHTGVLLASIALAAVAVLVVFNTIRLTIYHAREEIEIMRLVGASNWFIRGPFIVQGAVIGVSAVLIASVLLALSIVSFRPWVETFIPNFSLFRFVSAYIFPILFWQLVVGIGVGVLSSTIAIHKHLKV